MVQRSEKNGKNAFESRRKSACLPHRESRLRAQMLRRYVRAAIAVSYSRLVGAPSEQRRRRGREAIGRVCCALKNTPT